ncbi:unnamed protein product [Toxocara canis]|uniref:Transposase n=1 Tax=Toxocara canis TaxID=6265 RepID=A0A183UUH8_TOXCA|nr:unnamed protein product [Toxocara canis]
MRLGSTRIGAAEVVSVTWTVNMIRFEEPVRTAAPGFEKHIAVKPTNHWLGAKTHEHCSCNKALLGVDLAYRLLAQRAKLLVRRLSAVLLCN